MLGLGLGLSDIPIRGRGATPLTKYLSDRGLTGSNAGANFEEGKYWLPSTSDPTSAPRWSTQGEFFAQYLASSTNRSWTDINGILQPTQAVNTPRFSYVGGRKWLAQNNAVTNKCTNYNANPTDLTGISISNPTGSGPAISVSSRPDIIAAAGLQNVCTSGNVIHVTVDNTNNGYVIIGSTGNANTHAFSGWLYVVSGSVTWVLPGQASGSFANIPGTTSGLMYFSQILSPNSNRSVGFRTTAAAEYYFILNQLEENTFASPTIVTTGAAATRAIETFELPAAAEAVLQQTAASVVVRGMLTRPAVSGGTTRRILGGPTNQYLTAGQGNSDSNALTGDGLSALAATLGSGSFLTGFGVALGFSGAGRSFVANGGSVATDTSVSTDPRTNVYLARDGNNTQYGDGYYNTIAIFPSRLTNTQLQALAVAA